MEKLLLLGKSMSRNLHTDLDIQQDLSTYIIYRFDLFFHSGFQNLSSIFFRFCKTIFDIFRILINDLIDQKKNFQKVLKKVLLHELCLHE